uniref:BTB domain-containing protein n=1 Tax=Globodera pallida TaxID=36090 RepID=A0A183BZ06_GLOPA
MAGIYRFYLKNSEGRDIEMRIHPNPSHSDYVSYIKRDVLFPQIQPADSITVFVEIDVAVETVTTSVDDSCRLSKPCICEHQLGDDYLKLLNDGVLTDFTIRVVQEKDHGNDGGGKSGSSGGAECSTALQPQQNEDVREIPVHKAILAARSPVFAAMLQHVDTSESKTGVLEIKDVECGVVKEMLNFIYSGKSSSPEINEIASDLLIAADKYRLEELKTHCEHCLIQAINFENACQLLIIADMYGAQFLRKRVLQFIMQHPKKITQTTLWHPLRNRADMIDRSDSSFLFHGINHLFMAGKLRQHSLSSVRKLQELLHDCNLQLAAFRCQTQQIGTGADSAQLRRELDNNAKGCFRACETTKNSVLPQLKREGNAFSQCVIGFIGCVSAFLLEIKRCEALEKTFRMDEAPMIAEPLVGPVEEMLETLENLITVHYSTSESSPESKVTPRRRRTGGCRPHCACVDLIAFITNTTIVRHIQFWLQKMDELSQSTARVGSQMLWNCVDTVTELHSIEAKCNGIKNDEKICSGVKLFENIECLHNLLKEAREKAEQLSGRIDKYFEDQERFDAGKTIFRALVASYDLRTKKEIQIGLCIIRNQIVSLHPKLQHNLELVLSAGSSKSAHLGMGMFT